MADCGGIWVELAGFGAILRGFRCAPGRMKGEVRRLERGGGLLALTIGCKPMISWLLDGGHRAHKVRFYALLKQNQNRYTRSALARRDFSWEKIPFSDFAAGYSSSDSALAATSSRAGPIRGQTRWVRIQPGWLPGLIMPDGGIIMCKLGKNKIENGLAFVSPTLPKEGRMGHPAFGLGLGWATRREDGACSLLEPREKILRGRGQTEQARRRIDTRSATDGQVVCHRCSSAERKDGPRRSPRTAP